MIWVALPHFVQDSFFEIRPWAKFWCCKIMRRSGPRTESSHLIKVQKNMPKRHCEPPRKVSPLRDRCSFETDDEYKQYLAQRRKQQEALRDRQRDRTKRSSPKREREQAERREAAAAQTAAKATAAKAVVVEAARQRAAAEQRLAALKQRTCAQPQCTCCAVSIRLTIKACDV